MSGVVEPQEPTTTTSDDVIGVARLIQNIKDNNVSYMVGVLVAWQLGLIDKLFTYGTGMC